jgi:hypothetical protein
VALSLQGYLTTGGNGNLQRPLSRTGEADPSRIKSARLAATTMLNPTLRLFLRLLCSATITMPP